MSPAPTIIDSDLMERLAYEGGKEITLRPNHAELKIGSRLFIAPLAIPQQRTAGDES